MGELDLGTVAAANDAWVGPAPEGSEVVETAEYRLVRLPARFPEPLQLQWVRSARPAEAVLEDVVARAVGFGLPEASVYVKLSAPDGFDEALLRRGRLAAGTGGGIVGYLDGTPVGVAGVEVTDGVARLWGGGVLEAYRGRGVYRALLAARLTYAVEHGATMALTQGNIATSSPILQRLGFVSYGQERSYRLPLG